MLKECFKCGQIKALSMFYKHPKMADGHLNKCKECAKKDVREHRENNESVREYDRLRNKEKRRFDQHKSRMAAWKKFHPERVKAHAAVLRAIKSGRLVPMPCEKCGEEKVVGHHDDYSKPLVVRWLCGRCHMKHHREERTF